MALDTNLQNLWNFNVASGNDTDIISSVLATQTDITYESGKLGNCAVFNGSSSKFRLPTSFPDFGTGAFTIAVWVKRAATGANHSIFFRQDPTGGHNSIFQIVLNSSNFLQVETYRGSENTNYPLTGTTAITDTKWHHVAITTTGSGGTLTMYIDGHFEASRSVGSANFTFNSATPAIGQYYQSWIPDQGYYFNGRMDQYCIWTRALSADEIAQIANSGRANDYPFTATPSLYGIVSYWKTDESSGDAVDVISVNDLTNANVTYQTGKINNGALFNSSSDLLSRTDANQSGLDITGSLSFFAWVKYTSTPSSNNASGILQKQTPAPNRGYQFYLYNNGGNLGLWVDLSTTGSDSTSATVNWTPSTGVWYLVGFVFDASAGTVKFYVNGSQQGSTATSMGTSIYNNNQDFRIGNLSNANIDGMIDEPFIASRAFSSTEESKIYNNGNGLQYPFPDAPTVTTQAVTDIDKTTATGNGNVTSDGGSAITERGTCISTSANPTTADTKFTTTGTTGAFTTSMTSLTKGQHYHVRAYAINSIGTSYGADVEFTAKNDVAVTKSLKYTVKKAPTAPTKSLKYCVKKAISTNTKSLKYTIKKVPTAPTKGLIYKIRKTRSNNIKDLGYRTIDWFHPGKLDLTVGSIISGILSDVYAEGGTNLILAETSGTPGFTYDFHFYNVAVANYSLHIQAKYTGQAGHKVRLQQWNFNTSAWDNVTNNSANGDFPYSAGITHYNFPLLDFNHISGGEIRLRINHAVAGNITHTFEIDHMMLQYLHTPTASLAYQIKSKQAQTKSLKYTVKKTPTAPTKSLTYDIKKTISPTKSLVYKIKSPKLQTKSLKYSVKITPTQPTKSLRYSVKGQVAKTKTLRYEVMSKTVVDVQKSVKYTILKSLQKTKNLTYKVKISGNNIIKGLTYDVRKPKQTTKGLNYKITKKHSTTKSLRYVMGIQTITVTKSLKYVVCNCQIKTKSLQYVVRIYPYKKKSSPYSRKNSPYTKL